MRRQTAEVRLRIVDAAYESFWRLGYRRASVDTIAARAGLTKRTVYGISDEAYSLLLADPDIEIVEHSEVPGDGDQAGVEPAYAASIGAAPPA